MYRFTRPRRVLGVLAVSLASLFGIAASAQAAESITVTFGTDPTEEVPLPITMRWTTATPRAYVAVTIKPNGQLGCPATHSIDDPNSTDVMQWIGGYTGGRTRNWTFADPGSWTLCGYLQRSISDPAPLAVTGPITLTTRSARANVAVTAPPRVDPREGFDISVAVESELRRTVIVTHKPAGPRACAASHALDDPVSLDVLAAAVHGTQTRTRTIFAPRTPGTYLLCAYVQEARNPAPEAVSSTTYVVGPDPCLTARATLARASQAVTTAQRLVRRYRRSYKGFQQRARHAREAERKRLQRLAKRDRMRYRRAILRLNDSGAALVTAEANVAAACPGR